MNPAGVRGSGQSGLTFMEVLVAILILAFSISTVLGLQSSIVRRAIRDRDQRQAMLVARSILAAIEINPGDLQQQETTKRADQLLASLIPEKQRDEAAVEEDERYMATLRVVEREIPIPTKKDIQIVFLEEVRLTIFWGEDTDEQLDVVYYTPVQNAAKK